MLGNRCFLCPRGATVWRGGMDINLCTGCSDLTNKEFEEKLSVAMKMFDQNGIRIFPGAKVRVGKKTREIQFMRFTQAFSEGKTGHLYWRAFLFGKKKEPFFDGVEGETRHKGIEVLNPKKMPRDYRDAEPDARSTEEKKKDFLQSGRKKKQPKNEDPVVKIELSKDIKGLLEQGRQATDPQVKSCLRRALRKLGHKGGFNAK